MFYTNQHVFPETIAKARTQSTTPMPPKAKRNDFCACGSGKKYKKCCLLKEQASRPLTKQLLDEASTNAISLLLDFSIKFPEPLKAPPLNRPVPEMPDAEAQTTLKNELLMPWILYLWHPPDAPSQALPSDRTVAARFLRQEGEKLDGITRRFMEAARLEPFSYWQVEGVSPGASLLMKDMVTGEERIVRDVSSSKTVARWDIFFAQVVGLEGTFIFNSIGVYPLAPDQFRQSIVAFAEGIKKQTGESADRRRLLGYQTEFILHYLQCVDEMLHPKLPELQNMDGDKLVFAKSRYVFGAASRPDVIKALISVRDVEKAGEEGGDAKFVWLALPKAPNNHNKGKVIKASIRVGQDRMESECNSEARDKALRKQILKHLGSLMTYESTNLQPFNPGKMSGELPQAGADKSGALDLATLSEEDRKRIEGMFEQQHMFWLDEQVPLLGGKTPRETSRTSQGKKQVADMINDWENMRSRAQDIQFCFDFNKLRAELGIALE